MPLQFTTNPEDRLLIRDIAKRADRLFRDLHDPRRKCPPQMHWEMTIAAAHSSGCPLRLDALLAADDANFAHDVFGIDRFIDKVSGEIDANQFWPRFAQPQVAEA